MSSNVVLTDPVSVSHQQAIMGATGVCPLCRQGLSHHERAVAVRSAHLILQVSTTVLQ